MKATARKRLMIWGAVALACVLVLAVAYYAYVYVPRPEQIRRGITAVQRGMTERQVDALMGGPADEVQKGNDLNNVYVGKTWRGGGAVGRVGFRNGRVEFKTSR